MIIRLHLKGLKQEKCQWQAWIHIENKIQIINPKQDFVSPYPLTKYNKGIRPSSMTKRADAKHQSIPHKEGSENPIASWGIPRSFRLSNNHTTETVRSMREQWMKNLFFHTNYDKRLGFTLSNIIK